MIWHIVIAAFVSVILCFMSFFAFMTVFKSRSYTFYWDTGKSLPDFNSDPYKAQCKKFLERTNFPDEYFRLSNKSYLCFKPNMLASAIAPPLVYYEWTHASTTLYPLEQPHPAWIWQWVYWFLISLGLVWIYKRIMK